MKFAVIICLILCLWEIEVAAKTRTSWKKKDRGRGGKWKKGLIPAFIYKDNRVYCNRTLRPEVHVQYVLAGCNITLAHPNRPRSQSWLRAVLSPEEKKQEDMRTEGKGKSKSKKKKFTSTEQQQTSRQPVKREVLREALMECNRSDKADNETRATDIANMHKWYKQMCFGFAPLNNETISRRNATITTPGVLLMTNVTVEDSGIYQARSGRSYKEFNLQVEKPHFKIKIVTKKQVEKILVPKAE
ncbi:unnamed protein product [Cylicocyclus nassatus]|uniref:Uncharacterized protein n=1 Tax=Cylicocyclus nassatus TaxID=53992 RepID=A0AA36GW64_CYLNA|nr:unnamed protein product [Cylicocyclus nassatus]